MNEIGCIDTLIVGFGFSCIPLCIELDARGCSYIIISNNNPVWKGLEEQNRLDFDLVSSYYSSFYSYDMVNNLKTDEYPTVKEFYSMHLRYYEKYKSRIRNETVESIENFDDHSFVYTDTGRIFKSTNVIVSTGYERKMNQNLASFDPNIQNKTVVFRSMGDSANLLFAKLIPGNNKIICLNSGFACLDKMVEQNKKTFTLDQLESHNIRLLFPKFYSSLHGFGFENFVSLSPLPHKVADFLNSFTTKVKKTFYPNIFAIAFPQTVRSTALLPKSHSNIKLPRKTRKRMLNPLAKFSAAIVIKYWPIDTYAKMFGENLEKSIEDGYILNDITYFMMTGLIKLWPKSKTKVDIDKKTVEYEGEILNYDHLIEGNHESPKLPKIYIKHSGKDRRYHYRYKNNYLGIVPKNLKNIYLVGYTRPITGGLANITEMQCLFVTKMILDVKFRSNIKENIKEKITQYNEKYFITDFKGPVDHLVYYGFYTEEVARVLDINIRLRDCRSIKQLHQYIMFPNSAIKYRQSGEFEVEGCDRLVDYIDRTHQRFVGPYLMMGTYFAYNLLCALFYVMLFVGGNIPLPFLIVLFVLQYFLAPILMIPTSYAQSVFVSSYTATRFILLLGAMVLLVVEGAKWFIPVLAADFLVTYMVRKFFPEKSRITFNDLKIKKKYKAFFDRYIRAYNRVKG